MKFIHDDGGRAAAGYRGSAGDCVCRAVAIAAGRPYQDVYRELSNLARKERKSRGASARNGIHTNRKWFRDYMRAFGFTWTPTMGIGTGCQIHLHDGELPDGRLVVAISKHVTAVIDGVIHDTYDPQRDAVWTKYVDIPLDGLSQGSPTISRRCVYGYWTFTP